MKFHICTIYNICLSNLYFLPCKTDSLLLLFLTFTQSFPKVDPAKSLSFLQLSILLLTLPTSLPSPIATVEVLLCVVDAIVVGASVVGASVVGATVVGATVVGATVVGASVVGVTVVGPPVAGATVVGTSVVGATVVGAAIVGVVDSFVVEAVASSILIFLKLIFVPASTLCPNSTLLLSGCLLLCMFLLKFLYHLPIYLYIPVDPFYLKDLLLYQLNMLLMQ